MSPDTPEFERLVNRMKTAAFTNSNAAFLGSIMCQLGDIIWDETVETAETDGINLWWNPTWFLSLPEPTRKTVLLHELWHAGRLHGIRGVGRDPEDWNNACDIVINNGLQAEGCTFDGTKPLLDRKFDGLSEEEVYDKIHQPPPPQPCGGGGQGAGQQPQKKQKPGGGGSGQGQQGQGQQPPKQQPGGFGNDIKQTPQAQQQNAVGRTVMAVQQAQAANQAGNLPGNIKSTLDKFLNPKLPWERLLWRFFEELTEDGISWQKRNRRYPDVYMPGHVKAEGGLVHLAYFLDVSGSVSDYDVLRFNSEVKYVKDQFRPEKMTLILFDTKIQATYEFGEDDEFEKVVIIGRGGTSLACVHDWIEKNQPTAALVFTDMECYPMEKLTHPIPVMWIVSGHGGHTPNFGEVIQID